MTTESLLNTNDNWVPSQYLATWQKKPFQACKPSRYFPFLSNQLGCSELCQVKSPVSSTGVGRHTEGPTLFSTERELLCVLLALLKARTAVPFGNLHSHSSDCCALCGSRQPIATQLRDDGIKGAQNQHLVWNTWKIKDRSFPPRRDKDSILGMWPAWSWCTQGTRIQKDTGAGPAEPTAGAQGTQGRQTPSPVQPMLLWTALPITDSA